MKRAAGKVAMFIAMLMSVSVGFAQSKTDDERMSRDIEVAENVLATLIKQQFEKRRTFFPLSVEGSYAPGYGVTFRVPSQGFGPMLWAPEIDEALDGVPGSFSYSIVTDGNEIISEDVKGEPKRNGRAERKPRQHKVNSDSLRISYNQKIIDAAKNFIADYNEMVGQLGADEKIVITNRGEGQRVWFNSFASGGRQSYLSIEGLKSDMVLYKQNKITRDQLMAKIRVVNSEMDDELQPDLELLTSIFNRLYQQDLSKSFFSQENIYYERLKGFGVIYYMQVYSSNQEGDLWSMPTIHEDELDQKARDQKVKELYPVFDKSIREDMLEYGRTLKSLKEDESLVFNVTLTKCKGCDIPSSVEYSVKNSVLADYSAGKISKEGAMAKFAIKKGANQ